MKVLELLDSKDKWIQGNLAIDADGQHVSPSSPQAVKWDLAGALLRCYEPAQWSEAHQLVMIAINDMASKDAPPYSVVWVWNDVPGRTWDQIKEVLRAADI